MTIIETKTAAHRGANTTCPDILPTEINLQFRFDRDFLFWVFGVEEASLLLYLEGSE